MTDSKPFAALSSALLARKGHAKPAMRPQAVQLSQDMGQQLEDLGWNDMGGDVEPSSVVQLPFPGSVAGNHPDNHEFPVVHEQLETIEREFAPSDAQVEPTQPTHAVVEVSTNRAFPAPRAAPGSRGKAAFTLRLDSERHLRLRLVCAVNHRSAQQIVTQALDEFLAKQPDVNGHAEGNSK